MMCSGFVWACLLDCFAEVSSELLLGFHVHLAGSHLARPQPLFGGEKFGDHSVRFFALLPSLQESGLSGADLRLAAGVRKRVPWLQRVVVQDDTRASTLHLISLSVLIQLLLEAVSVGGDLNLLDRRQRAKVRTTPNIALGVVPHGRCEVVHLWSLVDIAMAKLNNIGIPCIVHNHICKVKVLRAIFNLQWLNAFFAFSATGGVLIRLINRQFFLTVVSNMQRLCHKLV